MVFWILAVVAAAIVLFTFVYWWTDEGLLAIFPALLAAVLSGAIGAGIVGLFLLIPSEQRTEETHQLRAISSGSEASGRFFLGSGYVDGRRTLNYIAQEDGYSRLGQAVASASRVYEDASDPTVTEYTFRYSNGWVIPWDFVTGWAWDFHIPENSVLENYTITNE